MAILKINSSATLVSKVPFYDIFCLVLSEMLLASNNRGGDQISRKSD